MIVDWKISFIFRSCIQVLNVESKLSKEKFNHLWKKNSSYKSTFRNFTKFTGPRVSEFCEISKGGLIWWNFSFTTLKFLFRKKSVEIFQEEKCVSWNTIQFVDTIKFHSCNHDNVSLIERLKNFHFSCHRYYSFKSCLKILKKRSQLCC